MKIFIKETRENKKFVPEVVAALRDEELYQLLVIADTLRMGRSREKEIAIAELNKHIQHYVEIEGEYYEDSICE